MADILLREPAIIQAGDTISWKRTLPKYPASDGWQLSYRFINASAYIDVTASADGDDHLVVIPASTSATYQPGDYVWQAYVTKGAERYTVDAGHLTIRQNLAAMPFGYDARSQAQRALDDLRAALANWLSTSGTVREYTIAGRTMSFASADEIKARIQLAEREVAREAIAERLAKGLDPLRRVLVRF
jgi:hypothetical protein